MEEFFVESKETFSFKLDDFEGPLDLLLHMLKEAKIEIKNIFVSNITGQYLRYVEEMRALDLEKASNFAGMAATLLDIKLRSILPRTEEEDVAWLALLRSMPISAVNIRTSIPAISNSSAEDACATKPFS